MDGPDAPPTPAEIREPGRRLADAWDRFYDECFATIRQCPGVRRLPEADRDDCIQEVMTELVRRFGADRPEVPPEGIVPWIRAVSRNKAADVVRRRFRKPEVAFDDGSGGALADHRPDRPDADAPAPGPGESIALVWEALLSLDHQVPVTSYLVFYLRTMEGWSVVEVAELFQITPEQVRFRCHRVKKKFAALLERRRGRGDDGP